MEVGKMTNLDVTQQVILDGAESNAAEDIYQFRASVAERFSAIACMGGGA
jgi:hypothetical protein